MTNKPESAAVPAGPTPPSAVEQFELELTLHSVHATDWWLVDRVRQALTAGGPASAGPTPPKVEDLLRPQQIIKKWRRLTNTQRAADPLAGLPVDYFTDLLNELEAALVAARGPTLPAAGLTTQQTSELYETVIGLWNHWRQSLPPSSFSHSDGLRFAAMVDARFPKMAAGGPTLSTPFEDQHRVQAGGPTPHPDLRRAAQELIKAVERTGDHTQWFASISRLKAALGVPTQVRENTMAYVYELTEQRTELGVWSVEGIDSESGDCVKVNFYGPDSRLRAEAYLQWVAPAPPKETV